MQIHPNQRAPLQCIHPWLCTATGVRSASVAALDTTLPVLFKYVNLKLKQDVCGVSLLISVNAVTVMVLALYLRLSSIPHC